MAAKAKNAEAEAKDEADEPEGEGAQPKRKLPLKLIAIAGAGFIVLAGGGGGAYVFFHGKAEEKPAAPVVKPVAFFDVPEVMVNLSGAAGERAQYLKLKIVLEVKEEKQVESIKPNLPRVTDIFQTYLRELRSSDLTGSAGLFRLREELTRRVNAAVSPNQVSAVLFKEIVVQ